MTKSSEQYAAETLTGTPVFTDGKRATLVNTGKRLTCLHVYGLDRHRELWSKQLGQPIRFTSTGKKIKYLA